MDEYFQSLSCSSQQTGGLIYKKSLNSLGIKIILTKSFRPLFHYSPLSPLSHPGWSSKCQPFMCHGHQPTRNEEPIMVEQGPKWGAEQGRVFGTRHRLCSCWREGRSGARGQGQGRGGRAALKKLKDGSYLPPEYESFTILITISTAILVCKETDPDFLHSLHEPGTHPTACSSAAPQPAEPAPVLNASRAVLPKVCPTECYFPRECFEDIS